MNKAGLIGGMSWESTVLYYQWINQGVRNVRGGLHSAPLLINSVDFAEIEKLQHQGDWLSAGKLLAQAGCSLQAAGADFIVICTNTMHKVSAQVVEAIDLPLLHIVEPTAAAISAAGYSRVGLLGTAFTMEDDFYRGRMEADHGIEVLVPDAPAREEVHRIIYEELCCGVISDASRQRFLGIVESLQVAGAQGVILGCTEITLLIRQEQTRVPLFDTTALHADAIVSQIVA